MRVALLLALTLAACGPTVSTPVPVSVPVPVSARIPPELLQPIVLGPPPIFVTPGDSAARACLTEAGVERLQGLLLDLRAAALTCRAVLREVGR